MRRWVSARCNRQTALTLGSHRVVRERRRWRAAAAVSLHCEASPDQVQWIRRDNARSPRRRACNDALEVRETVAMKLRRRRPIAWRLRSCSNVTVPPQQQARVDVEGGELDARVRVYSCYLRRVASE